MKEKPKKFKAVVPEDVDRYMKDVVKSMEGKMEFKSDDTSEVDTTINFHETDHPVMTLYGSDNYTKEIIRFETNGDIYLHGKLIENDLEVVEGFREFSKINGYNYQESMLGKVEKLVKTIHNDMELGKQVRNLFKSK